jgi:phage repressor protein C with HTH and peptisase S24 domain
LARPKAFPKGIEGIVVQGDCLEPLINDGKIVIVDRNAWVEPGDITLFLTDSELYLGRYLISKKEPWLENKYGKHRINDLQSVAFVIEAIKNIGAFS